MHKILFDFLELSMFIYYLMKWIGDFNMEEKICQMPFKLLNLQLHLQRGNIQQKMMTVKKMTGHRIKNQVFIANKGVGLSLDNGPSRKALKILLYTLYMLVVRFIIS